MASQDVIKKIEEGYKKLQEAKDCKSLLKKYLTKDVMDACKGRKSKLGATLLDVIQSGWYSCLLFLLCDGHRRSKCIINSWP